MAKRFNYKVDDLFNPVLKALHILGGSGSIQEIEDQVSKILKLTDDEINEIHRGSRTKLNYRLAWAKNYLKRFGLLENSSRGVWSLTSTGQKTNSVNKEKVLRDLSLIGKAKQTMIDIVAGHKEETESEEVTELKWQDDLLEILLNLPPDSFERLCQRILRELGFVNVEVTGRTGDGGIDGKGVLRLSGVLSFYIMFQCKRFKGSISPSYIRDFRGALMGRADKGLFITTGSFTKESKREAQREGASPIDLIDGTQLMDHMKELGLGIDVHQVESIEIHKDWFTNI